MLEYFKNESVYKLPYRHIHSTRPPRHMFQFCLIHLELAVGKFKCASAYIHAYNL